MTSTKRFAKKMWDAISHKDAIFNIDYEHMYVMTKENDDDPVAEIRIGSYLGDFVCEFRNVNSDKNGKIWHYKPNLETGYFEINDDSLTQSSPLLHNEIRRIGTQLARTSSSLQEGGCKIEMLEGLYVIEGTNGGVERVSIKKTNIANTVQIGVNTFYRLTKSTSRWLGDWERVSLTWRSSKKQQMSTKIGKPIYELDCSFSDKRGIELCYVLELKQYVFKHGENIHHKLSGDNECPIGSYENKIDVLDYYDRLHIAETFGIFMQLYKELSPKMSGQEIIDISTAIDIAQHVARKQKQSDIKNCTICMDACIDTIAIPCGHIYCCKKCSTVINKKCAICMSDINEFVDKQ